MFEIALAILFGTFIGSLVLMFGLKWVNRMDALDRIKRDGFNLKG